MATKRLASSGAAFKKVTFVKALENASTPGSAVVYLREGGPAGSVLFTIELSANEERTYVFADEPLSCPDVSKAVYVDIASGSAEVVVVGR